MCISWTRKGLISLMHGVTMKIIITYIQSVYNYTPERHHVSTVYNVAAILWLKCAVHVMLFLLINVLYFCIIIFRSNCAVHCFLQFLAVMLYQCVVQKCPELFCEDPICPYYYWYYLRFYIPHAQCFCCKIFTFSNLFCFVIAFTIF